LKNVSINISLLKFIKNNKVSQFNKIAVEGGLMLIKALNFLGKLLVKLIRLLVGFFSWLFKFLFSRILVKIYFNIFRFKNKVLKEKSSTQLLHKNLAYLFIFLLSVSFIQTNFKTRNKVSAATNNHISKTVMANLVKNEFSSLKDEELIEETYTPGSLLTVGQEKYDEIGRAHV